MKMVAPRGLVFSVFLIVFLLWKRARFENSNFYKDGSFVFESWFVKKTKNVPRKRDRLKHAVFDFGAPA